MGTPITKTNDESVVTALTVEFDETYLQSVLDEFNADHTKQLTLNEAREYLAEYMMDNTYYAFKEWLEGEG